MDFGGALFRDGRPLPGVRVNVLGMSDRLMHLAEARSDENGVFTVVWVLPADEDPGQWRLTVRVWPPGTPKGWHVVKTDIAFKANTSCHLGRVDVP